MICGCITLGYVLEGIGPVHALPVTRLQWMSSFRGGIDQAAQPGYSLSSGCLNIQGQHDRGSPPLKQLAGTKAYMLYADRDSTVGFILKVHV
jgi:hypothetical protein